METILVPKEWADFLTGVGIASSPKQESEQKKKIFLDPGHSEKETGASSAKGAQEEDLNRLQAGLIKKGLEATGRFEVTIFDPENDDLYAIGAASKGYDMFISLHHNSYSGTEDPGTEVLYDNDKAEAQSKKLAENLSVAISKILGVRNRGIKPFAGAVLDTAERQGVFPVVLVESYFLNPYTQAQAEDRSEKAAMAIIDVVEDWF
jgi:N-acetylmuramoyl-L-alanine amidase